MWYRQIFIAIAVSIGLSSCKERTLSEPCDIIRIDSLVFGSEMSLDSMRAVAPLFFNDELQMSHIEDRRNDTLLLELYDSVRRVFTPHKIDSIETLCADVFAKVKDCFPDFHAPRVYMYMSEWDFTRPVIYSPSDSTMLIHADLYLGGSSKVYEGLHDYIRCQMELKNIGVHIAQSLADEMVGAVKGHRLIDYIAAHGVKMYLVSRFLPSEATLSRLFLYDQQQWGMVKTNEAAIWDYFLSHGLLFRSDADYQVRFFNLAPFSSFYTRHDAQIPWGVGRYIGYRMVQRYVDSRGPSLSELISTPPDSILRYSRYNPKS